jgi:hypothetical protein
MERTKPVPVRNPGLRRSSGCSGGLKFVPEKEVVWVDFKHFAYGTMRSGFVRNGANLKIVFSDGVWKLFAGYRRAQ